MPVNVNAMLKPLLRRLEAERGRVDAQISAIQQALDGTPRRKSMNTAARRAVSRRMKAYWAKRRATRKAKAAKG